MAEAYIQFPVPGCIVEFMQGNKAVQAWVMEAQGASVRIITEARRESKIPPSRLLPWLGPVYTGDFSKQDIADRLELHRKEREQLLSTIDIVQIWELAQGELNAAGAAWLAELVWAAPTPDQVAAMGHACLACKTHFKFSPPHFEIFTQDRVSARLSEQELQRQREEFAVQGAEFFRALWDIHLGRRGPLRADEHPEPELALRLETLVRQRLADPELHDADGTWKLLTKPLPEDPHLALHLAVAWGLVPKHHNFWCDRAEYDTLPTWHEPHSDLLEKLCADVREEMEKSLERTKESSLQHQDFISVDPVDTKDIDDGFYVRRADDGSFALSLAFACPAGFWPFGSELDKAVLRRGTSIYLPEATYHMLPETIGINLFSLLENATRPALRLDITLTPDGDLISLTPRIAWVTLKANISYEACQTLIVPESEDSLPITQQESDAARRYAPMLQDAYTLAKALQAQRLQQGAVITERPDPQVTVSLTEQGEHSVSITQPEFCQAPQLIVSEFMILANSALAAWARDQGIPLFFRTQDVAVPKEFSGIWAEPHEIARVVKHLPPAGIETTPKPHAGLGTKTYAPVTSPLRRYTDLVNEGQIVHYLACGKPRFEKSELDALLPLLSNRLEQAGQIQRFRPRYWKLLFFKQQGDKVWWDAVVTEENDMYATVSVPLAQLFVRTRRAVLGDKIHPGQRLKIRLGKINPLHNEIQVLAAMEE